MQQLPEQIANKIPARLHIEFWCRRARYEYVEEISQDAFKLFVILGGAILLKPVIDSIVSGLTGLEENWGYWLAILLLCLLAVQHSFLEVMRWRNEIYVVARDNVNGGGRVFKFWGWLNKKSVDEPITSRSPTLIFDQNAWQRLWGKVTGEQMARITLKGQNNTFLDGQRVDPRFGRAIQDMVGNMPGAADDAPGLNQIEYIDQAMAKGLIDGKEARDAALILLRRHIYGD